MTDRPGTSRAAGRGLAGVLLVAIALIAAEARPAFAQQSAAAPTPVLVPAPDDAAEVEADSDDEDQPPALGLGRNGLPELADVGVLPTPAPGRSAVAGSLGYGYTEDVLDDGGDHHRAAFSIAASYALLRWLAVATRFDTRYDAQVGGTGDGDHGVLGATRVLARAGQAVAPGSWLGGELALRFPPAQDAALGVQTISFDLRALGSHALGPRTLIAGSAGLRIDRSSHGVDGFDRLSGEDRFALGASQSNALLLGFGAAHVLGRMTLLGEWGWDLLVGSAAPVATRSPMRLVLGTRYALLSDLQLEGLFAIGLSGRPVLDADAPLVPVEPRASLSVGIVYRFFPGALPGTAEPELASVRGRVVDQRGAPIAGASVGLGARAVRSSRDGTFALHELPPGPSSLRVAAAGYAPQAFALQLQRGPARLAPIALSANIGALRGRVLDGDGLPVAGARVSINSASKDVSCDERGGFTLDALPAGTLELYVQAPQWEPMTVPAVVLPGQELQLDVVLRDRLSSGQIRGTVRGSDGRPLVAVVAIEELSVREATAEDGSFALDVQPGHYTVTVSAVGHEPEQRSVDVELNGVTVLPIDLRSAR